MDPMLARLPGLVPLKMDDWIVLDEASPAQMAYRDHLLSSRRRIVYDMMPAAHAPACELLQELADVLSRRKDFQFENDSIRRPDGRTVSLIDQPPLVAAAKLIQDDLLLLRSNGDTHHLIGGVLCFPAFWTLSQKMGRSVLATHSPVPEYNASLAARVERILHKLEPEHPLMRANYLVYSNPDLHQPAGEGTQRIVEPDVPLFVRVERQTLRGLPASGAIVFAIHTYVVPAHTLPKQAFDTLAVLKPSLLG